MDIPVRRMGLLVQLPTHAAPYDFSGCLLREVGSFVAAYCRTLFQSSRHSVLFCHCCSSVAKTNVTLFNNSGDLGSAGHMRCVSLRWHLAFAPGAWSASRGNLLRLRLGFLTRIAFSSDPQTTFCFACGVGDSGHKGSCKRICSLLFFRSPSYWTILAPIHSSTKRMAT